MSRGRPRWLRKGAILLAVAHAVAAHAAVEVSSKELAEKKQWVRNNLLATRAIPPFSFQYDGRSSSALLPQWTRGQSTTVLDRHRTRQVLTWTTNGLQVRCVVVEYKDYPVVEWTVYLKNLATRDTPVLEQIQGLDAGFSRGEGPEFVLNGIHGDWCTADSFMPFQIRLVPSLTTNFSPFPHSGKSCDGPRGWPYYNVQMPGGGVIVAIGWPGQWASSFTRDAGVGLRIKAGQELTRMFLKPGEEIRTPQITLLFWRGTDVVRAQNLWRRFYLAHIIPRVNGQPPSGLAQIQVGGAVGDTNYVTKFLEAGITPDLCWRDANWYTMSTNAPFKGGDAWLNTGTWEVDPNRYPSGFRPFSDWVHARGMKFVLWFEPERVGDPEHSWLGTQHPDWLLRPGSAGLILDEGNPAAFRWLTNHFDRLIKANGVDWYREDMNGGGPAPSRRAHDPPDRQGITENFYVQNHLAYWDALLAMNPGLRIDSCASGGRRNDLETMRRAVPLLRSDFQWPSMANVVEGNQCQTYGLSFWLPFQGTGTYAYEPYAFRSFYMASFGMGRLTPENTAAQRQAYAECKRIGPLMLFGDYYPLTPYSLADNVWIGWQFNRPDTREGCVQLFRRTNAPAASLNIRLQGLVARKTYGVEDFDKGPLGRHTGRELMERGLVIHLDPRQSAILHYVAQ